ncbi:MAG: ABC transporter ATP-binding protein YtrB [Candidatus Heimdallarchaeota archaeon LC_2]|nr:MAG: ABC transporter ATP-binding protein YtrB [Candidatus Heimdallarchaeota archaeon LC_2]
MADLKPIGETKKPILICSSLTKKFGGLAVIRDLSCNTVSNSLGLLGPNGSGKTTLIKLMLKLIPPTSGKIELDLSEGGLRVVSDQPKLPEEMTIDEWIETIEQMYGPLTRNIDIQADFGLEGDWKIKNLSAGQRRKAALLLVFYGTPKLIILDEPTNFLDIVSREYILKLLKEHLHITQAKLILASHRLEEIRLFCDDVLILKEGEIMTQVSLTNQVPELYSIIVDDTDKLIAELRESNVFYFVEESYLGKIVKAENSDAVFTAAARFMVDGGHIFSFEAIDQLQRSIEDLLK